MNINVNIDINSVLDSLDIKSLEQYIRKRKIQQIEEHESGKKLNKNAIKLNVTKPIKLPYRDDDYSDDFETTWDGYNEEDVFQL